MAKEYEHKAIEVVEQVKPLPVLLAGEGAGGWRLVQAWTTSQGKDYLLFRRRKGSTASK